MLLPQKSLSVVGGVLVGIAASQETKLGFVSGAAFPPRRWKADTPLSLLAALSFCLIVGVFIFFFPQEKAIAKRAAAIFVKSSIAWLLLTLVKKVVISCSFRVWYASSLGWFFPQRNNGETCFCKREEGRWSSFSIFLARYDRKKKRNIWLEIMWRRGRLNFVNAEMLLILVSRNLELCLFWNSWGEEYPGLK